MLDVIQDKGHNTANSPNFEKSSRNPAYKSNRSFEKLALQYLIFKKYSDCKSYSSPVFFDSDSFRICMCHFKTKSPLLTKNFWHRVIYLCEWVHLKKNIVISTFFWCTIYIYINMRWLENTNTEVYKSLINDCNKLYTYYIILQPFMSSASPSKPNMATYLKKKLEQTKLPHGQLKTILKQNQNSKIHVTF